MKDFLLALGCLLVAPATCASPPGRDAILLSNVEALTLRANRMTSARRVSPVPQLSCDSSRKICNLYQPDVMRCTNSGYGYDSEDVQWTCRADLPPEFKLGATDVSCEGYRDSDDDWVLKGSCGVSYRLLLTELGEERYGHRDSHGDSGRPKSGMTTFQGIFSWLGDLIFFGFLLAMVALIFWPLLASCTWLRRNRREVPRPRRRWGWPWGWGGNYYPPPPPPPPPYDPYDPYTYTPHQPTWTPGFWTGAVSGMTAGYGLGQSGNSGRRDTSGNSSSGNGSSQDSSRSQQSSKTTTSTGFGTTTRR